jgi:hypothetical protein
MEEEAWRWMGSSQSPFKEIKAEPGMTAGFRPSMRSEREVLYAICWIKIQLDYRSQSFPPYHIPRP